LKHESSLEKLKFSLGLEYKQETVLRRQLLKEYEKFIGIEFYDRVKLLWGIITFSLLLYALGCIHSILISHIPDPYPI